MHSLIFNDGFLTDTFVATALLDMCWTVFLDMYAKCCCMFFVEKVFDEMSHRDLVSWNAMMVGFLENKLYGHAIGVFREVVHHDSLDHDQVTFSSVWSACNVLVFLIMTLGFMYMGILLSVV